MLIVGGVATTGEKRVDERVDEILGVCRVVRAFPVMVSEKHESRRRDLPCFCADELPAMQSPKDLFFSL